MANCPRCKGSGMGLSSPDGLLVWGTPLTEFAITFRTITQRVTLGVHAALILLVASGLLALGWRAAQLTEITDLLTLAFWMNGGSLIAWFWFCMLLLAFLMFRIAEYGQLVKSLPTWGMSHRMQAAYETHATERARHRVDVAQYVSDAAWEVVANAFTLAQQLNRAEVGTAHLFAAAISSRAGAGFLARVGLSFDTLKTPLAKVVAAGEGSGKPPVLSKDAKKTLLLAYAAARNDHRQHVGVVEVFVQAFLADQRLQDLLDGLGYPPDNVVHVAEWVRLQDVLREDHRRFVALASLKPATAMNRSMTARATPFLDRFSEDLTVAARMGYLAPLVGRENTVEEVLRGIESGRRSVILVGAPGTGKRAIVEGLARRMVEEDVPEPLFDRRLVALSVPQLVASGDPSLAAERLQTILDEISASGNIIVILEGIETLAGGTSGPLDLAEILGAELDHGRFIVIGTTTLDAYTRYLERRPLGARLLRINVPELDHDNAMRVCMAKSPSIEYDHRVFFSFAAIEKAVTLSGRYIHDRALPEKALDVMKEAAVLAQKQGASAAAGKARIPVTAEHVAQIVHDMSQIPVEAVSEDESSKLLALEDRLHERIIGQNAAVTAVAQAMRRARAELREGKRPIANFLFLGPTGVGKTELSKALAADYFGSEAAMVRVDMSEYQSPSSVTRMIGAPGDERGGLLTEAVRRKPFTIVLLDEIEKAHPDILNLFLQVMDDGRLTDGIGRTIDFTQVVLIATSNAGTQYIQDETRKGTNAEVIKTGLLERELKGIFRPEFLNRFDATIIFSPLTPQDVQAITRLLIASVAARMEEKGIGFRAEEGAIIALAQLGFDPAFGARPLRRVIQDRVENALADLILRAAIKRRDTAVLKPDLSVTVEQAKEIA